MEQGGLPTYTHVQQVLVTCIYLSKTYIPAHIYMHVYGTSSCQRHTENLAISTLDRAQMEPESNAPHVLIFPLRSEERRVGKE